MSLTASQASGSGVHETSVSSHIFLRICESWPYVSERAYSHVPHAALWGVQQESGVSGSFLQTIQSSIAVARVGFPLSAIIQQPN